MNGNYEKIVKDNILKVFEMYSPEELSTNLPAVKQGQGFAFRAFGFDCRLEPDGIRLNGKPETGVLGILITLYALHSKPEPMIVEPVKSFKDFPDSMPYVGAFATHTEQILVPDVEKIEKVKSTIVETHEGELSSGHGDFSFILKPLPKIALKYIFYLADEDFPASVTCLFSNNARRFIPLDGLADVGEYTSKKILDLI